MGQTHGFGWLKQFLADAGIIPGPTPITAADVEQATRKMLAVARPKMEVREVVWTPTGRRDRKQTSHKLDPKRPGRRKAARMAARGY